MIGGFEQDMLAANNVKITKKEILNSLKKAMLSSLVSVSGATYSNFVFPALTSFFT